MMAHGLNLDVTGGTGEPWKGDRHGESSSVCGGCAHRGRQEALACSGSAVIRAHLKWWERDERPRETQEVLQSPSQSSLWGKKRKELELGSLWPGGRGDYRTQEQNWAVRRGSRSGGIIPGLGPGSAEFRGHGTFVPGFPPLCPE